MMPGKTALLGDFICVQSPQLDRLGYRTASRTESPALERLFAAFRMKDARLMRNHAD